jgi:phospholipid/cholesterol/gamma-HCH transport system substrate-binding protein
MRRLVPALLAAGALLVAVLLVGGGSDDTYTLKLRLANAGGLRNGSPVVIGGVPIGQVHLNAHRDYVEAELQIKRKYSPIGKDAIAGIIAQNVIGQKQVRVQPGDRRVPAADGYQLPAGQVLETTDLDQLLSTLDPDTRTRLAILINETGTAFAGRKLDFSTFMREFAPALSSGGKVLNELTVDNRALTRLVGTSDRFVAALARDRKKLARVLDNAGQAAETVATKREQLRATLRQAPGGLRSARTFLAELRRTTTPLGETAKLLTRTAPSLSQVLDRIGPFERQAGPTIRSLEPLGPIMHRTGVHTSPQLKRLIPTSADLVKLLSTEVPPAGSTLNGSVDNALAAVDNWAHAIQFRDGMGHIFRGEASVAPDAVTSLVDRLVALLPDVVGTSKKAKAKQDAPAAPSAPPAASDAAPAKPKAPAGKPLVPDDLGRKVGEGVGAIVEKILGRDSSGTTGKGPAGGVVPLLDYLLGK